MHLHLSLVSFYFFLQLYLKISNKLLHVQLNVKFTLVTGWSNSGAPDLTVLDPAIVSSGQLTDSRSDSPPHWMKTMEQLTEGGPHPLWNNLLPYNLTSGGLPSGLGPHTGPAGTAAPTQRSVAPMWPPTSPPPGFNNISPLHHPKQHEPHKIDSKQHFLQHC